MISGSGRAFPQRLTIRAFSSPFSCWISIHKAYSRSGVFKVKSHRPRKGFTSPSDSGEVLADEAGCKYAQLRAREQNIKARKTLCGCIIVLETKFTNWLTSFFHITDSLSRMPSRPRTENACCDHTSYNVLTDLKPLPVGRSSCHAVP